MVKVVRFGPNPAYKPTPEKKAIWETIKGQAVKSLSYTSAMENVKNSGGMYAILPDAAPEAASPGVRLPEEMTRDELILTGLQLGIDMSKKQMKKADLVKSIRLQMDAVQLLEDEDEGTGAE